MERDVYQTVRGEGNKTPKGDEKHSLSTFKQTQRYCLFLFFYIFFLNCGFDKNILIIFLHTAATRSGRQVKMAFIHTVAKPPRDVRIQQEIHGTAAQQPSQGRYR